MPASAVIRHQSNVLLAGARASDLTVFDGDAVPRSRPYHAQQSVELNVLLAESVGLIRAGLRSLLEQEDDITVAGEASTGEEAVALALDMLPDVVVIDIRIAGLSALAATRRILSDPRLSSVNVVMLTASEGDEELYSAVRSGASGLVLLDTDPGELLSAVRVVAGGGAQLPPSATRRLVEYFASRPDPQLLYSEGARPPSRPT